jgi:hypothetical protein
MSKIWQTNSVTVAHTRCQGGSSSTIVCEKASRRQLSTSSRPKEVACINPLFAMHRAVARHRFVFHACNRSKNSMSRANKPSGPDHEPSPMLSLFFHPANYSACATLKANSNLSIVVAKANQKYRGPSKMQSRQVRLIFRVQLLLTLRESDWCECWSLQQQLPWPPWLPCFPSPSSSSAF